jgi:hypothetical protein
MAGKVPGENLARALLRNLSIRALILRERLNCTHTHTHTIQCHGPQFCVRTTSHADIKTFKRTRNVIIICMHICSRTS